MNKHAFRCCLILLFAGSLASAAPVSEPPPAQADPLRLFPDSTVFFVKAATTQGSSNWRSRCAPTAAAPGPAQARDFQESTNYLRFRQFLAYAEKRASAQPGRSAGPGRRQWHCPRHDAAAGGGEGRQEGTAVPRRHQGKNADLTRKLANFGARSRGAGGGPRGEQDARSAQEPYQGAEIIRIGNEFHAAVVGAAVVFGNARDRGRRHRPEPGRGTEERSSNGHAGGRPALIAPHALVWGWADMEQVKTIPGAKDKLYTLPADDANVHVILGGWLDVARRSPLPRLRRGE